MSQERRIQALCLMGILAVSACTSAATPAPTTAPPASSGPGSAAPTAAPTAVTGSLVLGFPTVPDSSHLPMLVAVDEMNKAGWHITNTGFTGPEVLAAAQASGQVQIGVGATNANFSAIQAGAKIKIVGTEEKIAWDLIATTAIKKCDDLAGPGVRWALNSPGGATTAFANYWIQANCTAANATSLANNVKYISGSDTRAAAMIAGQLDATLETPLDWIVIQSKAPGKFQVMADFGKDPALANFLNNTITVNDNWAKANPDVVVAFLKGVIKGYKDAQSNPDLMTTAATEAKIPWDDNTKQAILDEFKSGVFPADLGVPTDALQFTLQFSMKYSTVKVGLNAADTIDLSYLQKAQTGS